MLKYKIPQIVTLTHYMLKYRIPQIVTLTRDNFGGLKYKKKRIQFLGFSLESGRRGSNPRPSAWKANALSTELLPQFFVGKDGFEPPKSKDSRFTVCPIWPLWYLPLLLLRRFVSQLRCKDTTIYLNSKQNQSFLLQ